MAVVLCPAGNLRRFRDNDGEESFELNTREESREGTPRIYAANPSRQDRSAMANSPARR